MKSAIILLLCLSSIMVTAQRRSKSAVEENWTGEYTGTFTDLHGDKGTLQVSMAQSQMQMNGIVILTFENDSSITGSIRWQNGPVYQSSGMFRPSNTRHQDQYIRGGSDAEVETQKTSYECNWTFIIMTQVLCRARPQPCNAISPMYSAST